MPCPLRRPCKRTALDRQARSFALHNSGIFFRNRAYKGTACRAPTVSQSAFSKYQPCPSVQRYQWDVASLATRVRSKSSR